MVYRGKDTSGCRNDQGKKKEDSSKKEAVNKNEVLSPQHITVGTKPHFIMILLH